MSRQRGEKQNEGKPERREPNLELPSLKRRRKSEPEKATPKESTAQLPSPIVPQPTPARPPAQSKPTKPTAKAAAKKSATKATQKKPTAKTIQRKPPPPPQAKVTSSSEARTVPKPPAPPALSPKKSAAKLVPPAPPKSLTPPPAPKPPTSKTVPKPQVVEATKLAGSTPQVPVASSPAVALPPLQEPEQAKKFKEPRSQRWAGIAQGRVKNFPPYPVAGVTGGLCGLLTVFLAWGTAEGCETVRGVGNCGGFGLVALAIILAIVVMLGAAILQIFHVPDANTAAALGVGLVAILAMLFFLEQTQSPAMFFVIPILMAATFAAAVRITQVIRERSES